ncbi:MAG: dephospho-CoA kinase [Rhodocyclaceae bacterium]|nr:dephospho-CoA kinase [Rhodocyclaceae bacterium]
MSFVVGLTGGIGSGKSAAAERFAARGAAVIDTDVIARELTAAGGAGIAPIRAAFGAESLTPDGALDRAQMRRIAFADPAARARLEAILHPLIREESEARIRRLASADFPYALLVVPLLVESGNYRERVDRVCVVDCPEAIRVARVTARSSLSPAEVQSIMAAQASRAHRLAAADDIIDNAAGLPALDAQIDALHEKYRAMAKNRQESARTP